MYVLRLLAILAALTVVVSLGFWIFTGDTRYRAFAFKTLRFGVMAALVLFALLILERVALIPL